MSGSVEVAGVLQANGIDYLAVAYADEGIELRKGRYQCSNNGNESRAGKPP